MIHKIYQYRLHTKRNNVYLFIEVKLKLCYPKGLWFNWQCQVKHIVDSFPNSLIYNSMLFINIIDWTVQHMNMTTYTDQAR